mmetsp:Transcript_30952/g.74793  ORF Transcript_30952/g.74793 Transcript_30952/m.74793 type:complete len:227 (-) Transcript_30952:368-1048(-)
MDGKMGQAGHYKWEETIFDKVGHAEWEGMKRSFCFGAGCGLLGFGMLRWRRGGGAGGLSRNASSLSSASSRPSWGGYKFDPVPSRSNNGSNMHHQHLHHQYNSNNNTGSGFLLDTALSTIIGMGTSLLAIESDLFFPTTTTANGGSDGKNRSPAAAAVDLSCHSVGPRPICRGRHTLRSPDQRISQVSQILVAIRQSQGNREWVQRSHGTVRQLGMEGHQVLRGKR